MMSDENKNPCDESLSLDDVLSKGLIASNKASVYVNGVKCHTGIHETTIDFYHVSPSLEISDDKVVAAHVSRIVIPLSLTKEFAVMLAEQAEGWQKFTGIILPVNPCKEADEIEGK